MPFPILAGLAAAAIASSAAPTYTLSDAIAGPDGGWDLLAVDPDAHRLYVARSTGVMAVDLPTGKVSAGLVPLTRGHGVLPIPGTSRVIATSGGTGQAILFEGATGQVIATLAVGKNPDAIAFDPATKTVWVMNPGSGDISVIDPVAAKVIDTVAVPGGLELGAADGAGRLYVNIEDKNEVAVIDTKARKLLNRFPLKGCDGPTGIVYSAKAREIVSACGNGVAVVSATDGHAVANLKIGPRPDGAVYDPARDLAFVPSGGDGTLAVIRLGAAPAVVSTVGTAKGARTAALDPSTGRIYLPSAKYAAAVGNARPAAVPGSFAVMVVSPVADQ
jgi:YVTN family beta-propeller protein